MSQKLIMYLTDIQKMAKKDKNIVRLWQIILLNSFGLRCKLHKQD